MDPEAEAILIQLIGLILEGISYGIYCVIFAAYLRTRLKRKNDSGSQTVFFYLLTINFMFCTAYLVVSVAAAQPNMFLPGVYLAQNALYTLIDFTTQVILIYRCWIMWRKPLVMVVPILLSISFLAVALTTLICTATFPGYSTEGSAPSWYFSGVVSFFSISLGVNALVVGLIVFKILTVYRKFQGLKGRAAYVNGPGRDLLPIISILIESGVITFVAQLVQTIMYKLATLAFPVVAGLVVMIYGISTTIVLVRVEMGLAYNDKDHETSKTAIRFADSERSNDTVATAV